MKQGQTLIKVEPDENGVYHYHFPEYNPLKTLKVLGPGGTHFLINDVIINITEDGQTLVININK